MTELMLAVMILLFKDMINLINLGTPMTNFEAARPPQECRSGSLINLTNKKLFLKYQEHKSGHYLAED